MNNLLVEISDISNYPTAIVVAAGIIAGAWILVTFIKNEH